MIDSTNCFGSWIPVTMAFLVITWAPMASAQDPAGEQAAQSESYTDTGAVVSEEPTGEEQQVGQQLPAGDPEEPQPTEDQQTEQQQEAAPVGSRGIQPESRPEQPPAEQLPVEEQPVKHEPESQEKPSWIDHIKLKGDFRYRFETIDTEDTDLRYRHRIRARPAVIAEVVEDLDVVIQLGTGGIDDPVSNNQSLTEAFSSKPIWLDLAYFDWHPYFFDSVRLVGGKMNNPYYKVGKTELLWDPDLNPEGLAFTCKRELGIVEPFLNTSAFFVQERKEDDDTWLFGVQAGVKFSFMDGRFYALAGGGYVDYTSIEGKEVMWDPMDSFGNSATAIDVDGDGEDDILIYDEDYNLINGFGEIGGKAAGLPWAVFGDFVVNAAVDGGNTGWLFGALIGQSKNPLDLYVRYIYREILEDAVFGLFTDSDFIGGGADGKGHEWNVAFQAAKHVTLAFTFFYNRTPVKSGRDYYRSQSDLKLKF